MIPVGFERAEIERLQRRFERLFSVLQESMEAEAMETYGTFLPPVDICETPKAVWICLELAGVKVEEMLLTLNARELRIEGYKKASKRTQKAISHFCCERLYGKFQRRVKLRWAINLKKAKAELRNGLLEIYLPKLKDRRGQTVKIPVKVEKGDRGTKQVTDE